MAGLARLLGRPGRWRPTPVGRRSRRRGIRSRLGIAMSLALLPVILLGLVQARQDFQRQADDRRQDLQIAAARTAASARARIDEAGVLLTVLSPESVGAYCAPRLSALADRVDGYEALFRLDASGTVVCRSAGLSEAITDVGDRAWFARLRRGENMTLTRAGPEISAEPALIAAVRAQRPLGSFDGAMVALLPLAALTPDLDDPALPEGSQAALTDAEGRVLVATDPAAFDLAGPGGILGWVDRMRQADVSILEARDAQGRDRVYAGAVLAGRDVYVLLSAPAPGLLSWAWINPIGNVLMPLVAWLTALGAVMLVSERVVIRWLDYLERIAAIYARGRFTVRPTQAGHAPAEISVLAHSLDEMAETIVRRDAALNESLREKDALMREIHHRVKNNLQIISSLLSMQQRALTDEPAKAAVGDTRQRIAALALIYRTLYQSDNIRHADASEFLRELVGQLIASESGRGHLVTSSVTADSLVVDPDKLAPLALWLVEAVTNAQKHAFAGRGGTLEVRFKVNGDTSVLEVEDDGPGPQALVADAKGVGRTLMGAFAKQLRGEVAFVASPSGGTIARMVFATPEALNPNDPADLRPSPAS